MANSNFIIAEDTDNRFVFRRRLTGYANEIIVAIILFVFLLSINKSFDSIPLELLGIVFFTGFVILIIYTNSKGHKEYIFDKTDNIFSEKGVKICDLDDLKKIELFEKISTDKEETDLYYYAILQFGEGKEFVFDYTRDYRTLLSICDEISRFANIKKAIIVEKDMRGR